MRTIRRFDELGREDVDVAGGKGANLGELTQAGLPVPPGFVLTTAAYRAFVAGTGIGEKVLGIAAVPPDAGPEVYEAASARIRDLFAAAAVPEAMAREVLDAAGVLGDLPLAVRSSATAEDLADASFAGQQDTYLDVRGDRLLTAVRDCWASLWTARAMAYRARRGIAPSDVALAVVVQRMVDADAAGVMFTANPTNGRRNETVISAAWGLGESVVSGSVTTDDVVVEMPAGRVRSRTTASKAVMTVATGDGTTEESVPAEQRDRQVLDGHGAVALARLGARIEARFGAPQDVEWARAGGEFWIVQARPITALPEPEADAPTDWSVPDPKDAYYMRASIVEQLPDPLSPLFADLVDGSVTRSLQALFQEFVGQDVVGAGDVGLPIRAEKSLHELGMWAAAHDDLASALRTAPSTLLDGTADVDRATWREWQERFRAHLDRYGHMVYNLDFLNAVPADDPAPLLETLRFYLDGGGSDPNERQRRAAECREEATTAVLARLDPVRRAGFVRLLRWAQATAPVREDALADVGLAWPQLRRMLHEMGERLVAAGRIERTDDVFWLRRDEVLAPGHEALRDAVEERKADWRGRRRATPPQLLPEGTWWQAFEGMFPAASADQEGALIRGIGASAGQVTAPARVLGGPADFGRMQPGDVLVAGITTPAWTSLFPMASAVVTDVGGPLSHSSIVAREYGIPAVLGTGVATRRITDGARIRVDGDAGTVTLLDEEGAPPSGTGEPEPASQGRRAAVVGVGGAALAAAVWWGAMARKARAGRAS